MRFKNVRLEVVTGFVLLIAVATSGGSCGSSASRACIPGTSVACVCADARTGAQSCNAAGSAYGACVCAGAAGAGGNTDAAGGRSGGGSSGTTGGVAGMGGTGGTAGLSGTAGTGASVDAGSDAIPLPACSAPAVGGASGTTDHTSLVAALDLDITGNGPSDVYLERVDTATGTHSTSLAGYYAVANMAVSPNGQVYLINSGPQVSPGARMPPPAGLYGTDGSFVAGGFWDLVVAPDGSTIYASLNGNVDRNALAIDSQTFAVKSMVGLPTGSMPDEGLLGLGLSADGSQLAITVIDSDPTNNAIMIAGTVGGLSSPTATIALPGVAKGAPSYCHTLLDTPIFTGTGRVIAWDYDCQVMFQVDLATRTQLPTVDPGIGRSTYNWYMQTFAYDPVSARAYATPAGATGLVVIDPVAATACLLGGFSGPPLYVVAAPGGGAVYVVVESNSGTGSPFTLDRYDTRSGAFSRAIYTFSTAAQSVRMIRAVPSP